MGRNLVCAEMMRLNVRFRLCLNSVSGRCCSFIIKMIIKSWNVTIITIWYVYFCLKLNSYIHFDLISCFVHFLLWHITQYSILFYYEKKNTKTPHNFYQEIFPISILSKLFFFFLPYFQSKNNTKFEFFRKKNKNCIEKERKRQTDLRAKN